MSKAKKRIYAEINKVEAQDDGTLHVSGYASTNSKDSDGETVTTDCMRAALPDYMKFGAVREMHQASAAGTAISASIEESTGKTLFSAHVVDPIAILKVNTGVYKGFSIGGKVTERDTMDKKIIKGIHLYEVSLVDRPANPEAVFKLAKLESTPEDDVEELAEILDKGEITPAQILDLIKASKAPAEEPVVEPEPVVSVDQPLGKGLFGVSRFAEVLQSIGYLAEDTAWESQYEGDNSPLPASILQWLKDGMAIFTAMAQEECDELVSRLTAASGTPEVIQMAASKMAKAMEADDLTKAGAKFSKATKAALGSIHEACKAATEHLDALKYAEAEDAPDDAATKTVGTEPPASAAEATPEADATKVAKTTTDDTNGIVQPPNTSEDTLNKAVSAAIAPLNEALEKARKDIADLTATVQKYGKQPAHGKALLKAVTINKEDESAVHTNVEKAEDVPAEGTVERASYEMRKVFSQGGKRLA